MKINCNKIRQSEEKLLKFNLKAEKKTCMVLRLRTDGILRSNPSHKLFSDILIFIYIANAKEAEKRAPYMGLYFINHLLSESE